MNIENIDRVIQYFRDIAGKPNQPGIYMRYWATLPSRCTIGDFTADPHCLVQAAATSPCRTTGCLAGHTILALKDQLTADDDDIEGAAFRLLGLGEEDNDDLSMHPLFYESMWPGDLYNQLRHATVAEQPLVLARRLEYFKEYGK